MSLNLGAASNQVKPTDGIPTLMADANDHQRVTQNKYKKRVTQNTKPPEFDTKHNAFEDRRMTQTW